MCIDALLKITVKGGLPELLVVPDRVLLYQSVKVLLDVLAVVRVV